MQIVYIKKTMIVIMVVLEMKERKSKSCSRFAEL